MPSRTYLFALFMLALNGCGTDCRDIACDDLVNVIFSSMQTGDYTVLYEGKEYACAGGQADGEILAACGPHGFVLRSSTLDLNVAAQSDAWAGSAQALLEPVEVIDADDPECTLPCFRAETIMTIDSL